MTNRPDTEWLEQVPPPPDRSKLDTAEAVLRRMNDARRSEAAEFEFRRQALDAEAEAARRSWQQRCAEAERIVERERRAYRKAGGMVESGASARMLWYQLRRQ
jgi:hypothetical protein